MGGVQGRRQRTRAGSAPPLGPPRPKRNGGRTDEPDPWPTAPFPPTRTLAGAACACPSPCRELLLDLPPILPGKGRNINGIRHFHHGLLGLPLAPRGDTKVSIDTLV